MPHKIYLIANWKMQLNSSESIELAEKILKQEINQQKTEVILAASFTSIPELSKKIKNTPIKLAAQDISSHDKGQFTGQISAPQLKEWGVEYVIVGHSERRKFFQETDEQINLKTKAALAHNIIPIICIGETLQDRENKMSEVVIIRQLTSALQDIQLSKNQKLIIAYEPVWAISPAPPATPDDAEQNTQMMAHLLRDFFDEQTIKNQIITIYGGSADDKNIQSFLDKENIFGALIGGASLDENKFNAMIDISNKN